MKKLNLGCGKRTKKGWINLDKVPLDGVDIVHDIEHLPLPFKNNEFDIILCKALLEHIEYIPIMKELYRILKKNGKLIIIVPHFTSKFSYSDPTHENLFSVETFEYFVKDMKNNWYFNFGFNKLNIKLNFSKKPYYFYNYLIEPIVNINQTTRCLYEGSPLRIFPAQNLHIELIK